MARFVKILIIVDFVFCIVSFFLMSFSLVNISSGDIAAVGSVLMSPELFVAINKVCEKFQKAEEKSEEKKEEGNK